MAKKPPKPHKPKHQAPRDRPQIDESDVELGRVFKSSLQKELRYDTKDPLRWVTGLRRCLNKITADLAREKEERYTDEGFEEAEGLVKGLQKDAVELSRKAETFKEKAEECIGGLRYGWWRLSEADEL